MFPRLCKLFRKEATRKEPFVDPVLGRFSFDAALGWKKQIALGDIQAELVLGSDGESPSEEMLRTARSWAGEWHLQFPKIRDYIRSELRGWSDETSLLRAENFEVESIDILWRDKPEMSMVYFRYPGDDIRIWHVTFHRFDPQGFAYDD